MGALSSPEYMPSVWSREKEREREREREKARTPFRLYKCRKAPKTSTRKGRFGNTSGGEPKQSFELEIM